MVKSASTIVPCCDHQRRTCIQVERVNGHVKYIPLDVGVGLEVHTMGADVFDQRFTPMVNYPAAKACQLYVCYSQNIGATKEALDFMSQVINISEQEFKMATAKKTATSTGEKRKSESTKSNTPSATPTVGKTKGVKAPAEKAEKAEKAGKAEKAEKAEKAGKAEKKSGSAAQMFQDLIMDGKLTDDQIFDMVKEKFGLDDKKRGYVKWYRNHLKKQGKNPPEPKVSK